MELYLSLAGRRHLARQIHDQLRAAILEGRLRGGERLPATRTLAGRLGVSRNTVSDAYDRLMAEGFLRGRTGDGTYVAQGVPQRRRAAAAATVTAEMPARLVALPVGHPSGLPCDFRLGAPDAAHFPFDTWRRVSNHALRRLAKEMACYGAPQGLQELRAAIAGYIAFSRGVGCHAEEVVVTSGAQQALDLIGRVLIKPGSVVAVEEPGYPPVRALFSALGARVVGVPVDREGMVVARLPAGAALVYVTPSHQFPLGVPLSLPRRVALIEWAAARGAIVIEDDYDSEFRFGGRSLEALRSLDTMGRVVYVGTFSKVLLPALRLGFLVAPPALRDPIIAVKCMTDWQTHVLGQAALAKFMEAGHLAKHIRKMRRIYEARRGLLLDRLAEDFSDWLDPVPNAAGLHLTAMFKRPVNVSAFIAEGRTRGVGVHDLARFYADSRPPSGLIFGYGAIEEVAIRQGLHRLRALMRQASMLPLCRPMDCHDLRPRNDDPG